MQSQLISFRMDAPPSAKKVAIQVIGWIVWNEGSWDDNLFADCSLYVDRLGLATSISFKLFMLDFTFN